MVELRPASSDAHKYLGLAFSAQGEYGGALKEYNEALHRNPNNADVYYDIGVIRADQSDWKTLFPLTRKR